MSGGGHDAGDATVPAVMLLQCPAVSTQFGVISVPVQRNGPKVISATAGYSPGLASFPPTTADDGAAAAASSTAEASDTARARRKKLMKPGTTPPSETCICYMRHTWLAGLDVAGRLRPCPPGCLQGHAFRRRPRRAAGGRARGRSWSAAAPATGSASPCG